MHYPMDWCWKTKKRNSARISEKEHSIPGPHVANNTYEYVLTEKKCLKIEGLEQIRKENLTSKQGNSDDQRS